jgi:acyl carrier protein
MMQKDELIEALRNTAKMICAEQPDVPEPEVLKDLDSFSFVQVILEIENEYNVRVLERLDDFIGGTFEDLADFILEHGAEEPQPLQEARLAREAQAGTAGS